VAPAPVVIVEDDANIAELLGFVFRRGGFEPHVLSDGRAAERFVAAHPPAAAVVLDVMLPYRDGFEVAAAIRADGRWREVPIVMLSARALGADRERARELGVAEYVAKPFHPGAVLESVRALLGRGAG
jgi:DNA-binding response OmpR family regulator